MSIHDRKDPLRLGYVGVKSTDITKWRAFAVQLLGMEEGGLPGASELFFKMDQRAYRLSVHTAEENGLSHVGWEARSPDALERVAAAVEAAGFKIQRADKDLLNLRQVSDMFFLTDPSGTRLEIYCGMRVEEEKPFHSLAGVEFLTGSSGLGHVNLLVNNYQETLNFYTGTLGFSITDYRPSSRGTAIAFLGSDSRHHSYGMIDSKGAGTFIDHIMVEVTDFTHVGRVYDNVIDGAAPLSLTLGKHWNDQMTSFYMESPSGFDIEYGWGGRLIDRATWTTVQFNSAAIFGHRAASESAARRLGVKTWIDTDQLKGRGTE